MPHSIFGLIPCLDGALDSGNCAEGVLVIGYRNVSEFKEHDDAALCLAKPEAPLSSEAEEADLFVDEPNINLSLVESGNGNQNIESIFLLCFCVRKTCTHLHS